MTNSKSTKRALLTSALVVFMCVAMLIGTTFAWFTDTASTAVNKIQSGTLDVALEMKDADGNWVSAEGKTLDFVKAPGHENEEILWEPGCTYSLPELRIVNNGNLALKYKVVITGINGDAKLNEVIDWTIGGVEQGEEQHLAAGAVTDAFTITGHMQESAGNAYQGLSIDGVSITVYATQDTVEYDSNNNQYDKDATLPSVWDGHTVTAPAQDDENVYHITSAAEFAQYINELNNHPVNGTHRYDFADVVLDCDIDLGGAVLTVSGEGYMFDGSFDGKNHTVSNFTVKRTDGEYYTGLFSVYMQDATIKNLTVENGNVISNGKQVAAIVPSVYENATVDNCHAVDCVVSGNKKVGAVAGYAQTGAIVQNCSAEGCSIYASNNDADDANLFGYNNGGTFTNNTDKGGNTLSYGTTPAFVSTAADLRAALTPHGQNTDLGTIVLVNDITVSDWSAVVANYTSFVLDGNGHKIYGLTDALINAVGPNCNVVIKNLTLADVDISLDQATGGDNPTTGAFLREVNCEGGNTNLTIDNCHVDGGSVYSYKYAGGFIGMIGGNDTDTNNITIKNSSIKNLAVSTTDSSAGGFVAHTHSKLTITDCSVLGTTSVECAEDRAGGAAKAGYLVGTVNNRTTTISGCTVESSATLGNINAVAALNNGLVGRNLGTLNVAD